LSAGMAINMNIADELMFSKFKPSHMTDKSCTCIVEEEENPGDEYDRFRARGVAPDIWTKRVGIN